MKEHHLNFYHARKLVRTNRGCIKPNRGFIRQLLLWDRFHYEIRADPEVYFMWKMEIYSKEEKSETTILFHFIVFFMDVQWHLSPRCSVA